MVLSPSELAKHFKYKSFPKGLASIGQIVVEKLGKKVGKDFGEILNPYGDYWKVSWTDGTTEMIPQPSKNLALSLQPAQEIMMKSKLMQCTHYDSKGCHLDAYQDSLDDPRPPTKRTRSSSARRSQPQKKQSKNNNKSSVEELEVAATCALTAIECCSCLAFFSPF